MSPATLVGRFPACQVFLPDTAETVSWFHAIIYWSADGWWVRDLASRNGTFVDRERLKSGGEAPLAPGVPVAFGTPDDAWCIVGEGAPRAILVGQGPDYDVQLCGDALMLPDESEPEAMVYRSRDGGWLLERDDGGQPLDTETRFRAGGFEWRAILPGRPARTVERAAPVIRLGFTVSADQDFVRITATRHGQTLEAGAGTGGYLYFLLTLARRRLADRSDGVSEAEAGWAHVQELMDEHRVAEPTVNSWVFKARRQFERIGLDPSSIIERRARTGYLRLYLPDLDITDDGQRAK